MRLLTMDIFSHDFALRLVVQPGTQVPVLPDVLPEEPSHLIFSAVPSAECLERIRYWHCSRTQGMLELVFQSAQAQLLFFEAYKAMFTHIRAAGGAVINPRAQLLLIRRLGKWDLPKGKVEAGESMAEAAVREVSEETGITVTKIKAPLAHTYHIYPYKDDWALKTTYWFAMETDKTHTPVPQAEEDITSAVWQPMMTLEVEEMNTYPSIRQVLRQMVAIYRG